MSQSTPNKRTFKKRPGTTDKGKDYEDLTVVILILQLLRNKIFKHFDVWSNDRLFGAFDDVIVEMETENRDVEKFAVQLKHIVQKSKQLSLPSLTDDKGNFSIKKYFKSFQESKEHMNGYNLILATNLKFALKKTVQLELSEIGGEVFKIEVIESEANPILNSSKESKKCYKFKIVRDIKIMPFSETLNEYEIFFEKFYLYPNQINVDELKNKVREELKSIFLEDDVCDKFLKFITDWGLREEIKETLSKEMMEKVVVLLLLSTSIYPILFGEVKPNEIILQKAVSEFGVSVFGKKSLESVRRLWGDVKTKTNEDELQSIAQTYQINFDQNDCCNDESYTKLLWLMNKCPLIIQESSLAHKAIELCRTRKFILIRENLNEELPQCDVFQKLSHLKSHKIFKDLIENFKCLLPGGEVNLKYLLQESEEFQNVITTDELLIMAERPYQIQEQQEEVPVPYISRLLTKNVIDIMFLGKIDNETFVLISNVTTHSEINLLNTFNPVFIDDYGYTKSQDEMDSLPKRNLYISSKTFSKNDFHFICSKRETYKTYYHFKMSNRTLEWVETKGTCDTSNIDRYREKSHVVEENDLLTTAFSNSIHIISGDPGIGKSCLLKNLKINFSSKITTILLLSEDTTKICEFLQKTKSTEEDLENIILELKYSTHNELDKVLLKLLIRKCQVVFLWDALDEIVLETNVNLIIELIKKLTDRGVMQWLTCRTHMTGFLEKKFNVYSQKIVQFDEKQQDEYIRLRLGPNCSQKEILEDVIKKIKNHVVRIKHLDILSIPLQLYMLTELCLRDKDKYLKLLSQIFTVVDLYEYFVEEKFMFFYKDKIKVEAAYADQLKPTGKVYIRQYESAALRTILQEDILKQLNIDTEDVLEDAGRTGDSFGFLVEVKEERQKVLIKFAHISYAEYFVARYFARRKLLKIKNFLFKEKYRNIKFFFDMLLAKNCPTHVDVLYGNLPDLDTHLIQCEDSGGRTLLHLLCSWGERWPVLKFNKDGEKFILRGIDDDVKVQSVDYQNLLQNLLKEGDLDKRDRIFEMTPLEYAEANSCLFILALIEETRRISYFTFQSDDLNCTVLYYSVKLGLVSFIIFFEKYINHVKSKSNNSLLALACDSGHDQVVSLLIGYGTDINAVDEYGYTPLHLASSRGHYKIVSLLIASKVNIFSSTQNDFTPLGSASENGHVKVVKLLIDAGVDVNTSDRWNNTPLISASKKGHVEIVKLLVNAGAELNACDMFKWTPLYSACRNGHEEVVKFLLETRRIDINICNDKNETPFYEACSRGHEKIAKMLIQAGCDITFPNKHQETPLSVASSHGHDNIVDLLIKTGCDVNSQDKYQRTPIGRASENGHFETVKLLLQSKPIIHSFDKDGRTPLGAACKKGHLKICDLLVTAGANINIGNEVGWTSLHIACEQGHTEVVDFLLQNKAEINVCSKDGSTPLHVASAKGHKETSELLIASGAEVDALDSQKRTPLSFACQKNQERVVKLLSEHGANINSSDQNHQTPLYYASEHGHEGIVEFLIKKGADINAANVDGKTPLHISSDKDHYSVVELLLYSGADVTATDKYDKTPLDVASLTEDYRIAELLIKFTPDVNAVDKEGWSKLHFLPLRGRKLAEMLIQAGANVNATNPYRRTPLHVFCDCGYDDVVKLLVESGSVVNSAQLDGETPLHISSQWGYYSIVEFLLNSGANVDAVDEDGNTPLHIASDWGNDEIVKLLTQSGAKIDARNNFNETALHLASASGSKETVEFLIKSKLDVDSIAGNGRTPLHYASKKGSEEIVKMLIDSGASHDIRDGHGTTPLTEACSRGHVKIVQTLISFQANINNIDYNGLTPLRAAFHNNHKEIVELLTNLGEDLNCVEVVTSTPLYIACEFGDASTVESFIRMDANVECVVYNGWRPIHIACFKGRKTIVKDLLKAGACLDAATASGDGPIDLARENNHYEVVEILQNYKK